MISFSWLTCKNCQRMTTLMIKEDMMTMTYWFITETKLNLDNCLTRISTSIGPRNSLKWNVHVTVGRKDENVNMSNNGPTNNRNHASTVLLKLIFLESALTTFAFCSSTSNALSTAIVMWRIYDLFPSISCPSVMWICGSFIDIQLQRSNVCYSLLSSKSCLFDDYKDCKIGIFNLAPCLPVHWCLIIVLIIW